MVPPIWPIMQFLLLYSHICQTYGSIIKKIHQLIYLKFLMITVKDFGNKALVELLTHLQRTLRYCASNWVNNAISPVTVLSYLLNVWVPILKMLQYNSNY